MPERDEPSPAYIASLNKDARLGCRADLLEELDDVVERGLAGVAREAGVGHGVLGEHLDLVGLHGLADVRDVHVLLLVRRYCQIEQLL